MCSHGPAQFFLDVGIARWSSLRCAMICLTARGLCECEATHKSRSCRAVSDAEIIVIGAGVMGLAAAEALGRAGRSVVVLEQFRLGHDRGSSHGNARVFKLSYPDPQFVRLAQTALGRWRELEDESGDEIITTTGSIDVGEISGRQEALEQCGADFEFLDTPDVERRYGLKIDEHGEAL